MKEAQLYLPIIKGAKAEGWHLYRIVDDGINRKPFDIGGIAPNGIGVGLEVKLLSHMPKPEQPFPWALFPQHQRAWLRVLADCQGLSIIALHCLSLKQFHVLKLRNADDIQDHPMKFYQQRLHILQFHGVNNLIRGWEILLNASL